MGNGAGVCNGLGACSTTGGTTLSVGDNAIIVKGVTFKPNFFLVENGESTNPNTFTYGPITKGLVKICEASWLKLVSTYKHTGSNTTGASGSSASSSLGLGRSCVHMFFESFFVNFEKVDLGNDAMPLFEAHPRSYIPNRDALLLRLIKYLLSVPSDSFKVKTKLRSLGRAHARRGITERHLRIFSQALMMTLIGALGPKQATPTVINAWVEVISFVLHQMCFDKVYFMPRCHELFKMSSMSQGHGGMGEESSADFNFSTSCSHNTPLESEFALSNNHSLPSSNKNNDSSNTFANNNNNGSSKKLPYDVSHQNGSDETGNDEDAMVLVCIEGDAHNNQSHETNSSNNNHNNSDKNENGEITTTKKGGKVYSSGSCRIMEEWNNRKSGK